jgi:RNA polymerase sigma factor (sigma-70 family)
MSSFLRHLRHTLLPHDDGCKTDAELLSAFLTCREEVAFATLVRRHGPMVLGVCRRVLHDPHDAEDAFQATFLVLVRKAGSIVPRRMVGNWLYGVAYRTALKVKGTIGRRRARERPLLELRSPPAVDETWRELKQLLDQELLSLPDKYRVALILCDLEGKSRKEAARQLGWSEGTLSGRLARGRAMLAKRLTRRGLSLSATALAFELGSNVSTASVPGPLAAQTIHAAMWTAAGPAAAGGVIAAPVAALTEGVIKAMLVTKLKVATAVLLVASIGLGAGSFAIHSGAVAQVQPAASEQPAQRAGVTDRQRTPERPVSELSDNQKGYIYYVIIDAPGGGEETLSFLAIPNVTVLDALSKIPGLREAASKKYIWIARPKEDGSEQILPVEWTALTQRGENSINHALLPGDRLWVCSEPPGIQGKEAQKKEPDPPEPEEEPDPRLAQVLREWAKANSFWQMHYRFHQIERSESGDIKTRLRGEALVLKPDLLRVVFQDDKGQLKSIWASNGKEVHAFHVDNGSWLIAQRTADDAFERTSWAFGGFPMRDLKKRFEIRLTKEDTYYTYLDLKPRSQTDRANYTRLQVVLQRKGHWVRQLWVKEANGRSLTIDYEEPDTTPEPPLTPELIMKHSIPSFDGDEKHEPSSKKQ